MFAVVVRFMVKSESYERFLTLVKENAGESIKSEPGCNHFDVCTDAGNPQEVFLYELYADRKAFDEHLNSSHFQNFSQLTAFMVLDKQVITYSNVSQAGERGTTSDR